MEIVFDSNPIRRACLKATGKLKRRLDDIKAAETMADLENLPGHYHALKADRSGLWACHLEEPKRLVFRPIPESGALSADGRLDTKRVRAVCIMEVVNYHER